MNKIFYIFDNDKLEVLSIFLRYQNEDFYFKKCIIAPSCYQNIFKKIKENNDLSFSEGKKFFKDITCNVKKILYFFCCSYEDFCNEFLDYFERYLTSLLHHQIVLIFLMPEKKFLSDLQIIFQSTFAEQWVVDPFLIPSNNICYEALPVFSRNHYLEIKHNIILRYRYKKNQNQVFFDFFVKNLFLQRLEANDKNVLFIIVVNDDEVNWGFIENVLNTFSIENFKVYRLMNYKKIIHVMVYDKKMRMLLLKSFLKNIVLSFKDFFTWKIFLPSASSHKDFL